MTWFLPMMCNFGPGGMEPLANGGQLAEHHRQPGPGLDQCLVGHVLMRLDRNPLVIEPLGKEATLGRFDGLNLRGRRRGAAAAATASNPSQGMRRSGFMRLSDFDKSRQAARMGKRLALLPQTLRVEFDGFADILAARCRSSNRRIDPGVASCLGEDRATAWRLPSGAKFRRKSQRQPPSSARKGRAALLASRRTGRLLGHRHPRRLASSGTICRRCAGLAVCEMGSC